jgi:mannose-1-phosphate guanylyltransferase
MSLENQNLHILIIAGGSGTRFWPRSRAKKPKQLLALWDDKTLIEHTISRFENKVPLNRIWILTTKDLVESTKKILGNKYKEVRVLAEPAPKNTAPCILWGTFEIASFDSNATIAVMPSDHYIEDENKFLNDVFLGAKLAIEKKALVTLGIKPSRIETGYGYIEASLEDIQNNLKALQVKQFVEKPNYEKAKKYFESGNFFWNAGMFIFEAKVGLKSFETCMSSLFKVFEENLENFGVEKVYEKISAQDSISIDYGVMEKLTKLEAIPLFVVPSSCGWNDVGSFAALEDINCSKKGSVVECEASGNIVQTDDGLVALLGVSNLIVVRDGDVVMVTTKDKAQDVKKLLEEVKKQNPSLA